MPHPGKHWFHITFGTHGSWLPGDPRGFRTKHSKVHSSGDHRNPPPPGEHNELYEYNKQLTPNAICIPKHILPTIGNAITIHATQLGHQLIAISVAPMHVHLLIELPRKQATTEVGRIKRKASWSIRNELPGKVWANGCGVKPIRDKPHHINTFNYIVRHREQGAWVWSCKDETP
jgi:REP element-mobilizing transposase RayT